MDESKQLGKLAGLNFLKNMLKDWFCLPKRR